MTEQRHAPVDPRIKRLVDTAWERNKLELFYDLVSDAEAGLLRPVKVEREHREKALTALGIPAYHHSVFPFVHWAIFGERERAQECKVVDWDKLDAAAERIAREEGRSTQTEHEHLAELARQQSARCAELDVAMKIERAAHVATMAERDSLRERLTAAESRISELVRWQIPALAELSAWRAVEADGRRAAQFVYDYHGETNDAGQAAKRFLAGLPKREPQVEPERRAQCKNCLATSDGNGIMTHTADCAAPAPTKPAEPEPAKPPVEPEQQKAWVPKPGDIVTVTRGIHTGKRGRVWKVYADSAHVNLAPADTTLEAYVLLHFAWFYPDEPKEGEPGYVTDTEFDASLEERGERIRKQSREFRATMQVVDVALGRAEPPAVDVPRALELLRKAHDNCGNANVFQDMRCRLAAIILALGVEP